MKTTQARILQKAGGMKKIGLFHLILMLVLMIFTPAPAANPFTIKLGVVTKPGAAQNIMAEKFKKRLETRSDGAYTVKIFHSASIGNETEILQQIQMGTIHMGVIDGQENPLWVMEVYKFYEIQKFMTLTRHVYSPHINVASLNWFNGLPAAHQALITEAAVGAVLIPAMKRSGYPSDFSAAVQASGGSLGVVIPPSIPMIIFGFLTGASISRLFAAGILPGLLIGVSLITVSTLVAKKNGYAPGAVFSVRQIGIKDLVPIFTQASITAAGVFVETTAALICFYPPLTLWLSGLVGGN
jgi:hypothetical protein